MAIRVPVAADQRGRCFLPQRPAVRNRGGATLLPVIAQTVYLISTVSRVMHPLSAKVAIRVTLQKVLESYRAMLPGEMSQKPAGAPCFGVKTHAVAGE